MNQCSKIKLQAVGWLFLLGPYFFLTYSLVNQFTATRTNISSIVFGWEQYIPFLPWSIIPYWSLDFLYAISLFTCHSLTEQRRLASRLLAASTFACIGFLLYPLRYSFVRPKTDGFVGWWFTQLEQFDLPYNQSPSLHIILSWLLWQHFLRHTAKRHHWLVHSWFLLIALSVLTTWQHHFIDVITGIAVGMSIDWLIPVSNYIQTHTHSAQSLKLAKYYAIAALLSLIASIWLTPWLLWLTIALFIVSCAYRFGVGLICKCQNGYYTTAAYYLLLPWRLLMVISRYWYTLRIPASSAITAQIHLGSYPKTSIAQHAVLDLTFEYPRSSASKKLAYRCIPMLDLVCPNLLQLHQAVTELEQLRQQHHTVLVHCALGLTRSAVVVIAWLLAFDNFTSVQQAYSYVKQKRPKIVLTQQHIELLQQWQTQISNQQIIIT